MKLRILVADDHEVVRRGLCTLLQSHEGWEICGEATDGREAVDKAKQLKPDVVILDLMMPEMDGWKVCAEVRKFSNVPILIFSALDNPGMVASALDNGADDYIVKPVSSGVLVARLNKLTRRSEINPKPQVQPHAAATPA